jgi:hypothetical protein
MRIAIRVKDRRGYLVRGAKIAIATTKKSRALFKAPKAKATSKIGMASFIVPVRARALGRRVPFVVTARTPSAKAAKMAAVRLPKQKKSRR